MSQDTLEKVVSRLSQRLQRFSITERNKRPRTSTESDSDNQRAEENKKMAHNEPMAEALSQQVLALQAELTRLTTRVTALDEIPAIVEYEEVQIANANVADITLDMFKTLPEFGGDRNKYVSWRTSASNAMKIFGTVTNSSKYFQALNIVRNKIVGAASEALTNYNTVLNFNAIIARLDFTYADKRPIYIIEQEMNILQQKSLSIEEFYDEVNKKLNILISKITMTYTERGIANAMIREASSKALRTFITGLSGGLGRILYATNPETMPEAYAKIQTIVNDQERIRFANKYNMPMRIDGIPRLNPNFTSRKPGPENQANLQNKNNNYRPGHYRTHNGYDGNRYPHHYYGGNRQPPPRPEPMDVDRSSMNVNIGGRATNIHVQRNSLSPGSTPE